MGSPAFHAWWCRRKGTPISSDVKRPFVMIGYRAILQMRASLDAATEPERFKYIIELKTAT
ncbi:hypothetical protein GF406_18100 [candidate division KSB1 bacterium]|nr:hypothetical protein [candidate division KSB1 bacterium]